MKSATVSDLRNHFRRVSAWIENGERVEIVKRGRVFARLTPAVNTPRQVKKPDIMKRLKAHWGNRVFSMDEVAAMRAAELENEEG